VIDSPAFLRAGAAMPQSRGELGGAGHRTLPHDSESSYLPWGEGLRNAARWAAELGAGFPLRLEF